MPPGIRYPFHMAQALLPRPEFQSLSEEAVLAALADKRPGSNPVALEVARLIATYIEDFQGHVDRLGYIPQHILHLNPRWPIEAVAFRMATQAIPQTIIDP